jgi:hypothetical protein
MATPSPLQEEPNFSLILGGPSYQFLRWAHLSGPALEQVHRRILFTTLITWLPLALSTEFEDKWLPASNQKSNAHGDGLLGSADTQSLADLGNSFGFVREMRFVPFSLDDVFRLAATTAAPLLPSLLSVMPLDELLSRVIRNCFLKMHVGFSGG